MALLDQNVVSRIIFWSNRVKYNGFLVIDNYA